MNQANTNQLFSLIERVSDRSSALRMPSVNEISAWIEESGYVEKIYTQSDARVLVEELRANQINTWSDIRRKLEKLLYCIVEVLCQREGFDLMYQYPGEDETLHLGIVSRETSAGVDVYWGLRSLDRNQDHHWEYLVVDTPRLIDAIAWRVRARHSTSPYGWPERELDWAQEAKRAKLALDEIDGVKE